MTSKIVETPSRPVGMFVISYWGMWNPKMRGYFTQLADMAKQAEHIKFSAVLNPNSGPVMKESEVPEWENVITELRGAGVRIYGYVDCDYARRAMIDIENDIVMWKKKSIYSIFLDRSPNETGLMVDKLWPLLEKHSVERKYLNFGARVLTPITERIPSENVIFGSYENDANNVPVPVAQDPRCGALVYGCPVQKFNKIVDTLSTYKVVYVTRFTSDQWSHFEPNMADYANQLNGLPPVDKSTPEVDQSQGKSSVDGALNSIVQSSASDELSRMIQKLDEDLANLRTWAQIFKK
jgi:hypothetical protein